jgi:hypothetical protein
MKPTEEQLTALGNYRDIIDQHLPEIAEGIRVPPQTLKGWMEAKESRPANDHRRCWIS